MGCKNEVRCEGINVKEELYGLTDKEVRERVLRGEVNKIPKAPSRTLGQIIRANFFNVFNALNLVLAIVVILAGSPKNAIFAGIIIVNSLIGVFQELNAKKTLERLSVLSMAHCTVVRNGKIKEITVEELVKDDIVFLKTGDQILADCQLIYGDELEVDESMLTGEADPVYKKEGSSLLSGSFVVAGEGYGKVLKVGANTYCAQLADEARKFKIINSELQYSINKIIKILIWIIVPLGILLTATQLLFTDAGWQGAAIAAVSGIIGMVPEGLVLLTSATFIVSVVKLAKYDTLVQQLSATEILARVDVLCVDKTGTITEGKLNLAEIINFNNESRENIDKALAAIVQNLPSKNPTQEAILQAYKEEVKVDIKEKVPFSSRRKWGGIVLGNDEAWLLGAPEILLKDKHDEILEKVFIEAKKGRRVLLLGKVNQTSLKNGVNKEVEAEALILIEDVIRKEAPECINYFKEEGVALKVISGDNPITAAAVAKRAGVEGADKYIDARELPKDIEELKDVIDNYNIFGRVTPHEKKNIIKALQLKGHTVAMTGDGVNDVLALKEADCGIAMANGSDATKAVAQLVLMNSDFKSLPKVVREGRKQINNLERVAELFLSKTVFSVMLSLIFSLLVLPYPILPIQLSLVGSCAIGIPAFFLALLPNGERVKSNFLKRILSRSIPNGILLAVLSTVAYLLSYLSGATIEHVRTFTLVVVSGVSLIILLRVAMPLTKFKFILVSLMIACIVVVYLTPIGRLVFSLTTLSVREWITSSIIVAISWPILNVLNGIIRGIRKEKLQTT